MTNARVDTYAQKVMLIDREVPLRNLNESRPLIHQ